MGAFAREAANSYMGTMVPVFPSLAARSSMRPRTLMVWGSDVKWQCHKASFSHRIISFLLDNFFFPMLIELKRYQLRRYVSFVFEGLLSLSAAAYLSSSRKGMNSATEGFII